MNKNCISFMLQMLLIYMGAIPCWSQSNQPNDTNGLLITQDLRIEALIKKTNSIDKKLDGMLGYRVQISFGSSKKDALEIKAAFREVYKDVEGCVVYDMPYFKVRVGNFRTHLKAEELLREIKELYAGAFIVKDLVPIPELDMESD